MNDAVRMWTEIVFNVAYLGVIYTFVVLMFTFWPAGLAYAWYECQHRD